MRNFESAKIKVNDNMGNPVEIATIVVWSVTDTAEAMFEVDSYESYVTIQSESASRNMASSYAYDPRDDNSSEIALRSHPKLISDSENRNSTALGQSGCHCARSQDKPSCLCSGNRQCDAAAPTSQRYYCRPS